MKLIKNKSKGFTLIEVVIVLAIAALIILVVLQAVSAAQKGQRDSARKQEAARISSFLTQYSSNNAGKYPDSSATLSGSSGVLYQYDTTLMTKYTINNVTTAPTVGASCSASPSTYTVDYMVASGQYDYNLWVCQEAGGWSVIK